MLFKKKEIYQYKPLERVKDIDYTGNDCKEVARDNSYIYYRYKGYSDGSGGYILRREIGDQNKLVFFGNACTYNVSFKNYLFQVDRSGELGRFGITARNNTTGELTSFAWLSQKAIYFVTPDGYGRFHSQDRVNGVSVRGDKLFIDVSRKKSNDPHHKYPKPDPYDITADFMLVVEEVNGKFKATALFDKEDVARENSYKEQAKEEKKSADGAQPSQVTKSGISGINTKAAPTKTDKHDRKYWMDENGIVKCPGDSCSHNCNMECPIYLQTLAIPQLSNNRFEEAAKLLKKAVEIEPAFADAWNNLAACYGQMGDHKSAYAAYQKSYETVQKPNPLYGMAVATKNMKDYPVAETYANIYINKFGSDNRIQALLAEISESRLSEKISNESKVASIVPEVKQQETEQMPEKKVPEEVKPVPLKPIEEKRPETKLSDVQQGDASLENMRRYGKYMLLLLDEDTREAGYTALEKMESVFPEAAINVGQYYNGIDPQKAKKHFLVAADKGIAEAQWCYSQLMPHPTVLDFSVVEDREYLKYCLAAAEGGCSDAANEMGNICYRKEFYEEATYWYGMAYALEHPSGLAGVKGITKEWAKKGISKEFRAHIDGFTEERHATSLLLYKMFNQSLDVADIDDLMALAMKGENLAGFIAGLIFEQHNKDDMAYKVYNVLAFENHPHALRCYADMLLAGKGTKRDVNAAFRFYEQAAKGGNATAMFAMGQLAAKSGDKYLAACWFGQAYSRGMDMAGESLGNLADDV